MKLLDGPFPLDIFSRGVLSQRACSFSCPLESHPLSRPLPSFSLIFSPFFSLSPSFPWSLSLFHKISPCLLGRQQPQKPGAAEDTLQRSCPSAPVQGLQRGPGAPGPLTHAPPTCPPPPWHCWLHFLVMSFPFVRAGGAGWGCKGGTLGLAFLLIKWER